MRSITVFAIFIIVAGALVSAQFWKGPLEASANKGRAFADLANWLVERLGPLGASAIVMLVATGLAAIALRRSNIDRR